MNNESSGLEFNGNQEVIANVIKPEFEFKGSYTLDVDNNVPTDHDLDNELDNSSCKNSNIDNINTQGSTLAIDIDKNVHKNETLNKGAPTVIQQKYGASRST